MENDKVSDNLPSPLQKTEFPEPIIVTVKSKFSLFNIALIIFISILGTIFLYTKIRELQQKQLAQRLSYPSTSPNITTLPIASPSINPGSEKCPTSPNSLQNDTYPKNISVDGEMCKFTMFDSYDNNKITYTINYPQKWQVGIVGAAYVNLNFQKNSNENILMIDMVTKLPLETVDKAEYCFGGCSPLISTKETLISKAIKTFGKARVMETISSLDGKQIKRYFYLTNHKFDNGNQLYVFEYTPTNQEFDTEVIGLITSLVEYPTK